jgi:transketolase
VVKRNKRSGTTRAAATIGTDVQTLKQVDPQLAEKCITAVRMLTVDSVENAQAGHPGLPLGCAPIGYVLFDEVMKHSPKNPQWFNRDRFVLSAGHGVLLQYIMLHLVGYDSVQVDDLKSLCKWGSNCPGHPENMITGGIELTTGPLGQGTANAVGFAIAEKHLAARFNRPGHEIVNHYTYCLAGDGCLMEGISNEAGSIAGHLGLGKLIMFYDNNHNSIDGPTSITFDEDVCKRYEALGWHVQRVGDPDSHLDDLRQAIVRAKSVTDKPSFIQVDTTIGYGSSKQGTHKAHHGTFGAEEVEKIRERLHVDYKDPFTVPKEVIDHYRQNIDRGKQAEAEWNRALDRYQKEYPKEAQALNDLVNQRLSATWEDAIPDFSGEEKGDATRGWSQKVINAIADHLPGLIGGSADLATSNKLYLQAWGDFEKKTPAERNIRYGVREHAMAAISNGIALHRSGLIPFAGTFFVFTDYMRGAVRISALSHAGVIYICTHDSIGLGEDGPTHQPVEHLASFRAMPNMTVVRPGDAIEVAGAYKVAVKNRSGPTMIVLSRQKLSSAVVSGTSMEGVQQGGYTVSDNTEPGKVPDLIILATGAELELSEKAATKLREESNFAVRLVSMVCWELFEAQPQSYRDEVLPPECQARVSVEAGSKLGWREWVGPRGYIIAVDQFGASADYDTLFEKFGFSVDNIMNVAKQAIFAAV